MQFVPPQIHRSNPTEKSVRTSENQLISNFASTHPDFPNDLRDRLLPHAELTLNGMRPWRPDPSPSAWSGLHHLPPVNPLRPPGQLCLSFNGPDYRLSWDPHEDRAYYLGPATAVTVSMSSPLALNASPSPLHTFPYPSSTSPSLTYPHLYPPHLLQPALPPPSMART